MKGTYPRPAPSPERPLLNAPHPFRHHTNHYRPRTRHGWTAVVLFLGLMALVQPPIVFWVEERLLSGWLFGLPAFYVYLGAVYFAMIGVLIWAALRRL